MKQHDEQQRDRRHAKRIFHQCISVTGNDGLQLCQHLEPPLCSLFVPDSPDSVKNFLGTFCQPEGFVLKEDAKELLKCQAYALEIGNLDHYRPEISKSPAELFVN